MSEIAAEGPRRQAGPFVGKSESSSLGVYRGRITTSSDGEAVSAPDSHRRERGGGDIRCSTLLLKNRCLMAGGLPQDAQMTQSGSVSSLKWPRCTSPR